MENSSKCIAGNVGDLMKKKKFFIIIILCILMIFPTICNARADLGDLNAYGGGSGGSSQKLEDKAETILGVIQAIGVVVSVVMLMVIGIKYMMGSIEERAEYKETLKPYIIGAFLVFTGTTIPQLIYQIANNL